MRGEEWWVYAVMAVAVSVVAPRPALFAGEEYTLLPSTRVLLMSALDAFLDFLTIDLLGCAMPRSKPRPVSEHDSSVSLRQQPEGSLPELHGGFMQTRTHSGHHVMHHAYSGHHEE